MKEKFSENRKLKSIQKARQRLEMKPLYLVKGEKYKNYLKDFEKRKYSVELLRFKSGK